MSKHQDDAWLWVPGSGNAPAGYHFENVANKAWVVRDGMAMDRVGEKAYVVPTVTIEVKSMEARVSVLELELASANRYIDRIIARMSQVEDAVIRAGLMPEDRP